MLNIYVYITRPLRTNCRRLIYMAGELAAKYPEEVDVVIDEKEESEMTGEEQPRPYILVDDYLIGKSVSYEKLEEVVERKLGKID